MGSIDGLNDGGKKSDFAVIFGTKVNEDGTLSERLKERTHKAFELYQNKTVTKIFVSGGLGKEGFNEGSKMAKYLIDKGVTGRDIVIDNQGNNTISTARNFVKTFGNTNSVIVVTQFYHISRSKMAFKKVGVKNVHGAHCKYFEIRDFYSLFREFFGYYKYLLVY